MGTLIYTGNINTGVYIAKYFSLISSGIGLCLQPYLLAQMSSSALAFKVAVVSATGFFVFGTPFLLHFLCKRYVTQMYYNADTKTFTLFRLSFFARPTKFSFKPDDVKDSLPNPFSNFEAGGQAFLLDTDVIREEHPDAYIAFMRYDEPLDLEKYTTKTKEQTKE